MKRIELGTMVALIRGEGVTRVRSPLNIEHKKIVAGDGEIIQHKSLGDIIRERVVLSRDPFNCQGDFM